MKKISKRFISIIVCLAICISFSTMAIATNAESECYAETVNLENQDLISTYATTVGSMVFGFDKFGNASGTALKSQGTQGIVFSQKPNKITYYVVTADGSFGTVWIFLNGYGQFKLTADGKTHPIYLNGISLPINSNVNITYKSASTPILTISLVFSK